MAARPRHGSSPGTVRLSTALIIVVLAFSAGLTLGAFLPTAQVSAPGFGSVASAEQSDADPSLTQRKHILELETLTRNQPGNAQAWVHLGDTYYDAGQPGKAISAYERALSLNPDQPDAQTDLGTCYRLTGKYTEAIAQYDAVLSRQPRHHNARLNKGIVLYYDLGRKQEALDVWNTLLQLVPEAQGPDKTPLKEFIARHSAQ